VQSNTAVKKPTIGLKVVSLTDSVILTNKESFSSLMRFNTPVYVRENGSGGTSTARFRGTSSANTAVVWNGVNINSINNGQTGFNSITVSLFDAIDVRSGGESIEYGSGAIGGTVLLNNIFDYKKHLSNQIVTSFGSYETLQTLYKFSHGNSKLSTNIGLSFNKSENDYPLIETEYVNENGAYTNGNINANFSYRISNYETISYYFYNYRAERFLSGELPNPTAAKEKYNDFQQNNLLVYIHNKNKNQHTIKAGYLTQEYRYFADRNYPDFNFGSSRRFLMNYDFRRFLSDKSKIETFSEYDSTFGKTDQIMEHNRQQFSQSVIYTFEEKDLTLFNLKARKDFNSDYQVPFLFAFGAEIDVSKSVKIKVNGSKNYRVPTYNDLYWPGQGNEDLIPESSIQSEIGIAWSLNSLVLEVTSFYIDIKDKIVWTPVGDVNRPGVWVPINFSSVTSNGVEVMLNYKKSTGSNTFLMSSNYSYTLVLDNETEKELIFTPKHFLNMNISHSYKRFSSYIQYLYTGGIYTTEDNMKVKGAYLPSFGVANIGVNYKFIQLKEQQLSMGVKMNNIFNKYYETSPRRPMPNRNFNITINYKF
jgi:iron complex outermembrane receptor protein